MLWINLIGSFCVYVKYAQHSSAPGAIPCDEHMQLPGLVSW